MFLLISGGPPVHLDLFTFTSVTPSLVRIHSFACIQLPRDQSSAVLLLIALHSAQIFPLVYVLCVCACVHVWLRRCLGADFYGHRLPMKTKESTLESEMKRKSGEGMKEQGCEEMRRWEKEAWNPMMGSAQQPQDYSSSHNHQCRAPSQHNSASQNEISSTWKKSDDYFYRISLISK